MSTEKKDNSLLEKSLLRLKDYYDDKVLTPEVETLIEKICNSSGKEVFFNDNEIALLQTNEIKRVLSSYLGKSAYGIFPENLREIIFSTEDINFSEEINVNKNELLRLTSTQETKFLDGLCDLIDFVNECDINEKSVSRIVEKFSAIGLLITEAKADASADDVTDVVDYYLNKTSVSEQTVEKFSILLELGWIVSENSPKFYVEKNINMLAGDGVLLTSLGLVFSHKFPPLEPSKIKEIKEDLLKTYLGVEEIKTINLKDFKAAKRQLDLIMINAKKSHNFEFQKEITIARLTIYLNENSHRNDLNSAAKAYKYFLENPCSESLNYVNVFKTSGLYSEGKRLSKIMKDLDAQVEKNLCLKIELQAQQHQNVSVPQQRLLLALPATNSNVAENPEDISKNKATVERFKEGVKRPIIHIDDDYLNKLK